MRGATKRMVNMLLGLALLIASVVIYFSFIKPAYNDINILRGEWAVKSEIVRNQRRVVEDVKLILSKYESLSSTQKAISLILPNKEEYPTVINQLNGLSNSAGILLENININILPFPGGSDGGGILPVVKVMQLNLSLRGSYNAFKDFLGLIESNIRVMDVVSFNILSSESAENNYVLVVNVYYQSI